VNPYVEHLPQGIGIVEDYKWFSGACFMLTQKTLDRVGLFDQDTYFPCNFEDHDYWTRLMRKGLKCYKNFGMSVRHKEGQTVHAKDLSEHFMEMKRRFVEKHGFDNQEVFCGPKPFPFS
jgi:GT2 family glycosyltransferase